MTGWRARHHLCMVTPEPRCLYAFGAPWYCRQLPLDTVARSGPSGEGVPGIGERGERGGNRGEVAERQRVVVAEEREEEDGACLAGQVPARGVPVLDAQIRLEGALPILRLRQPTAPPHADDTRI